MSARLDLAVAAVQSHNVIGSTNEPSMAVEPPQAEPAVRGVYCSPAGLFWYHTSSVAAAAVKYVDELAVKCKHGMVCATFCQA